MNSEWITREELMRVSGWSERSIERRCASRQIHSRPMKNTGHRGRPAHEYYVPSLPTEVQLKISGAAGAALVSADVTTPKFDIYLPVTPDDFDEVRQKYELISEFIDFCNQPHPGAKLIDGKGVIRTRTQMAEYVADKHNISIATVWRLRKDWTTRGLKKKARKDKNKSRFFEKHPKAAQHAAYLYLGSGRGERNSATVVYEALSRDREMLELREDELPSYNTVRTWLNNIPPVYRVLAREGRRAYRERMAPYVSRNYDSAASNQIWVSDHMIHDVEVQNDCFDDAPIGTPIRLRFTALLDWHSRYVVGWSWAWEGSSRSITTALRNAVLQYGPAEMLYCDNGKDYLKVAKGAMPGYLRSQVEPEEWYAEELRRLEELGVLARLHMAVQHCIVRHPQSKHVERFFRTLHERFDKKFPTYTGGSPATRPDFTEEAMAHHRKLLRMGRAERSLHPGASVFMAMATAWIEDYHGRVHRGNSMRGRTPAQVFEQDRWKKSRPVPDAQVLALTLMERERRQVRECAVVLKQRRYMGETGSDRVVMHELNECDVMIAYDPLNLDRAAILDMQGRLLTWVRGESLLPQSSEANDAIAESMAERRRLEKHTAQAILGIAASARNNGAISEVERLARRVPVLPMAVGDHITQRTVRIRPRDIAVAPLSPEDNALLLYETED